MMDLHIHCDRCAGAVPSRLIGVDASDCGWVLIECAGGHQRWLRADTLSAAEEAARLHLQGAETLAQAEALLRRTKT